MSCLKYALPRIGPCGFDPLIHDWASWKEPGFKHLVEQRITIVNQPPYLLPKECKIKIFDLTKSQAALTFRKAELIPGHPVYPHQNFRMSDSISLHKFFGNLKQFIVKVGMACKIDLIKTSLPACESKNKIILFKVF